MTRLRDALAAGGGVVLAGAVLVAVAPGTGAEQYAEGLVEAAGNDYLFVVPIGVLAVTAVLAALGGRLRSGIDQARPPDPEGVPSGPAPGTAFDRLATGRRGALVGLSADRSEAVRESLRATAVKTVMRVGGCSRSEARERVDDGRWADDPAANAFLASEDRELTGVLDRLRAVVRFRRRLRRTAAAVAAYDDQPKRASETRHDRPGSRGFGVADGSGPGTSDGEEHDPAGETTRSEVADVDA
ncbi:DUF7269 family protein [Halobellus limi]|uniref:Uncharacterized protein n=1 Tax=Halobellus limi TaxID=699433 RepID=A0A1H6C4H1_9EURY|nr:hypothetical protein [Halobellus limi]QCC48614.1 hypothetical protein DV707_13630 [Halobellus limi]SEG67803.1 hypothetical protein SAMN04488133_3215 [Halobellus limi]